MNSLSCDKDCSKAFWGSLVLFLGVVFLMGQNGPVGKNLWLFTALYAGSFYLLWKIFKAFPESWSEKRQFIFIFSIAVLCRIFFLGFPESYDVNRYIWEGVLCSRDVNPYQYAPDDPVLRPWIDNIWQNINHKDKAACYPPMMILFFEFLASISKTPLFFKSVIILFDIAVIPILALLVRLRKTNLKYLVIYALNPLILVFISGEGHLDVIQIFFILLALYFYAIKKDGWSFLALGCAVMSKYYAIILFPFFVNKRNWKKSVIFFIPLFSYWPFSGLEIPFFSSLITFGTNMHYNDSLAVLLRLFFGFHAVPVSMVLLVLCLSIIFLLTPDPIKTSYLAFGILLLLMPTLHPWYFVLITPFLVFYPSRAWLYLHAAVAFTFPVLWTEYRTGIFQERYWLKYFEYLPFFILLMTDFIKRRQPLSSFSFGTVKNISIVIPTLNESKNLAGALASVQKEKEVVETVVVDGGSSDDTKKIAVDLNIKVVDSEKGRGLQIDEGVRQCCGDVLMVLHADCRIIPGTCNRIIKKLNHNSQCIGGALGMNYNFNSIKTRFLAILNNLRAGWMGISFGDQGQFFRAEALDVIGGFPKQMLMEDVELSLRFKENGASCYIPDGIKVSSSRWDCTGFFRSFNTVVTLCLLYFIKRRLGLGGSGREEFYRKYYQEDPLDIKPL